jgi:hypothetical protein
MCNSFSHLGDEPTHPFRPDADIFWVLVDDAAEPMEKALNLSVDGAGHKVTSGRNEGHGPGHHFKQQTSAGPNVDLK